MSWLSKRFKKHIKILDPVGAKLRKNTGGSYGDPLNMYQSHPSGVAESAPRPGPMLYTTPGSRQGVAGGQPGSPLRGTTVNFGMGGSREYSPNPFQAQLAQAQAVRAGGTQSQIPTGVAPPQQQLPPAQPPPMAGAPMPQQPMPGKGVPIRTPQGPKGAMLF